MFLVADSHNGRQTKIRSFLREDPAIAVLLAAADFEWTVRRAILALGYRPNSTIRKESLHRCSGIDEYKNVWLKEVAPYRKKRLPNIIPDWKFFREEAYNLRNQLIHGISTTTGRDFATVRCEAILDASAAIVGYANGRGVNLYERLPIRLKARSLK